MILENNSIPMARANYFLTFLMNEMRIMTDDDRDLPIKWNMMHMYSSCQLAKISAIKRGLDPELSGIIAALHDIAVVYTGKKEKHAENGEKYVRDLISMYNKEDKPYYPPISQEEEHTIISAVIQHSDKETRTSEDYTELLKDVDSFDRLLHGIKTKDSHLTRAKNYAMDIGIDIQ